MKVLFVAPAFLSNVYTAPMPMGLLSIATYLKNKDWEVKIVDRAIHKISIKNEIHTYQPDIIGVSVLSPKTLQDALKISKTAKKAGKIVVWGGAFASSIAELILKETFVDYVIKGEGEETWNQLLQHFEKKGREDSLYSIDGLVFKKGMDIIINKDRQMLRGDELPIIDYSLVDVRSYASPYYGCRKMLWVVSAKGCPYQCTFCYNKAFHHCKYRKRPLDYVISEIETLVKNYGADGIHFTDELWCRTPEEMRENCDRMRSLGLDFVWACYITAGMLSYDDFKYMYDSGCRAVFLGIESGSPERLKKIKKRLKYDEIKKTVIACSAAGITPWHSFIIGFPGESQEELKMTVDLGKELSSYGRIQFGCFIPYPGSELYDDLVKENKIQPSKDIKHFMKKSQFSWDFIPNNYSDVPNIDLKVVAAFGNLWSILPFYLFKDKKTKRVAVNPMVFIKAVIKGMVSTIKTNGWSFCSSTVISYMILILFSIFYALFFPKVREKYGLSIKDFLN